mmetsp:Transcript_10051/g.20535  ORF Transcript_10051/g.20535 Transcript_10051/m.20535 type:complete len:203 (-) Transcript_10051:1355-1963(-)
MNCFHMRHHCPMERMSSSNIEITDGRIRIRPSLLMVLVMRSGMLMRRLLPMCLSLRNPDTDMRPRYSVSHRISHSSRPENPCSAISSLSSANIWSEKMDDTSKSFSPGLSIKCCTLCISFAYSSLWCVIQYSKGLLLTAAMFHVTMRSFIGPSLSRPGSSALYVLPSSPSSMASSYASHASRFTWICPKMCAIFGNTDPTHR